MPGRAVERVDLVVPGAAATARAGLDLPDQLLAGAQHLAEGRTGQRAEAEPGADDRRRTGGEAAAVRGAGRGVRDGAPVEPVGVEEVLVLVVGGDQLRLTDTGRAGAVAVGAVLAALAVLGERRGGGGAFRRRPRLVRRLLGVAVVCDRGAAVGSWGVSDSASPVAPVGSSLLLGSVAIGRNPKGHG